jgi:hypothetical protein
LIYFKAAMSDVWRKSLVVQAAVLVSVYWGIMFAVPFLIADPELRPDALSWCLFGGLVGYCGYTGLVAFSRGDITRFVLRIVVPAALFVAAWIVIGVTRAYGMSGSDDH